MNWRRQSLNYPPNYDPVESAATIRIYDAQGRIDRAKTRRARREYLQKVRDIHYAWGREAFLFGQEFSTPPVWWRRGKRMAAAA